jgi:predicted enzyme related to lactoylglutathione lyase
MEVFLMLNPVVHFEIAAEDGKRAQDFYGKLFE